jgi:hypothetical protein
MSLITRQGKGSKLTIQEMDGNLEYLEVLGKPSFKNITDLIVNDVYTLTNDDFFKTLIYTGSVDVTINITSSLSLISTDFFNLLQVGSGKVTIGGSGVNIEHTTDVLPTSFGLNALLTVLVYDSTNVIVSGNLKLA